MIIQNKQNADQSDIFLIDLFIRGNDAHEAKSHLCPIQKAYLVILRVVVGLNRIRFILKIYVLQNSMSYEKISALKKLTLSAVDVT